MKALSRNFAIAIFVAFALGSIYGCAEEPLTFTGPGVQIWKLHIIYDSGVEIKDQTLVLRPSETEKDVFHVTATIDTETESEIWGKISLFMEWKGEIRNSAMICNITGIEAPIRGPNPGGSVLFGEAKGTFSKRRASGTIQVRDRRSSRYGKWTAEKIN